MAPRVLDIRRAGHRVSKSRAQDSSSRTGRLNLQGIDTENIIDSPETNGRALRSAHIIHRQSLQDDFRNSTASITEGPPKEEDEEDEEEPLLTKKRKRDHASNPMHDIDGDLSIEDDWSLGSGRLSSELPYSTPSPEIVNAERIKHIIPMNSKICGLTQASQAAIARNRPNELQFTFNIPLGHKGPFQVNIDLNPLISRLGAVKISGENVIAIGTTTTSAKSSRSLNECGRAQIPAAPMAPKTTGPGFIDLPAELRNRVYRMVLRHGISECVAISDHDMQYTSAFLRTCKQVHAEGASILYGENHFVFERDPRGRGQFFEKVWKEIGYGDDLRFLKSIGPRNISLMRSVGFCFEDASKGTSPRETLFARKYENNADLVEIFQLLKDHGRLDVVKLRFFGRGECRKETTEFFRTLKQVEANDVVFGQARWTKEWAMVFEVMNPDRYKYANYDQRIATGLRTALRDSMERGRVEVVPPPPPPKKRSRPWYGRYADESESE